MRKLINAVFLAVVIIGSTSIPTPVQALPTDPFETQYTYHFCDSVWTPHGRDCSGSLWGTVPTPRHGMVRHMERTNCVDGTFTEKWARYENGSWVYYPYPPEPGPCDH